MAARVSITGEGIVSAIGRGKEEVYESLVRKRSGIGEMRYLRSSHSELPVGEVGMSDDEMRSELGIESRYINRTALLGITAIGDALRDAGIERSSGRVVLICGTTVGGMDVTERYFLDMMERDDNLEALLTHDCGSCTKYMAEHFGIFDDYTTISTACSSAANAIMLGADMIERGEADIVVAGGAEGLSVFHLNGFNSLMILDGEKCRPFDKGRRGLNLGEGAAFLVLESEESRRARGAEAHAYVAGYGNACDAYHQTASSPEGEGAYRAMKEAMKEAGIEPRDIKYINAHGTGTESNDASECVAIKRLFGEWKPRVSSTKGYTGHTTSASGAIEAVVCLLALEKGYVPASVGVSEPVDGDIMFSEGEEIEGIEYVMDNSFGFGGNDTSLVFSRHGGEGKTRVWEREARVASDVVVDSEDGLVELKGYVNPMQTRRMGKLLKGALLSGLKALKEAGLERPDAIVASTSLGCLENSERFLKAMCEEGEAMLNPTLFMQSTHNTIGGLLAIQTKCHGYNITYTQGERSMEWAMRDAERLIKEGRARSVLVNYSDELTEIYKDDMRRLGVRVSENDVYSRSVVLVCGD